MYFSPFESFARFSSEPGDVSSQRPHRRADPGPRHYRAVAPPRIRPQRTRPTTLTKMFVAENLSESVINVLVNWQPVSSLLEGGDMSGDDVPLLGVAGPWGDAEIRLARQFEDLHQLLYTHGGISPTNAALEEVAKLIFIRLWSLRDPDAPPDLFNEAPTGPGFK